MTATETLSEFLKFLKDAPQRMRMAEAEEKEAFDETSDILHELELSELTYHEFAKLAKELKTTQGRRRVGKDTVENLKALAGWVDEHQVAIKALERVLGEMRKADLRMKNRTYTPRVREKK